MAQWGKITDFDGTVFRAKLIEQVGRCEYLYFRADKVYLVDSTGKVIEMVANFEEKLSAYRMS